MQKLRFIIIVCLLAIDVVSAAQERPNFLIIISDDHAYQAISAYGNRQVQTPSIDRIAKEGAIFKNAYVTNSICGPSRAVILTGKYSHKNGFKDNEHSSFDGAQNTFVKELTNSGYETAWIGKWHLETKPQGFTYWQVLPGQGQYYNPDFLNMDGSKTRIEGYVTNIVEDLAEDWLDKRDTSKPFCLIIGHKATHRTWIPDTMDMGRFENLRFLLPANFFDDYAGRKAAAVQEMTIAQTLILGYDLKIFESDSAASREGAIRRMNAAQRAKFDTCYKPIYQRFKSAHLSGNALAEWKFQRYMRDYFSTAASLDRNVGRALAYLDRHQLASNTIVIYLSDQGFYLGEHGWFDKRWMYEESFRTPMLMRYPGVVRPATENCDFVMNLDIAPTVLAAAGLTAPKDMQGLSFLPQLKNKKEEGRKSMYYHYYENGEHAVSPHFGIRTKCYKLIRFYERVNAWELYDLKKDPNEMKNLYGKRRYQQTTKKLKHELDKLINKYEDLDAAKILADNSLN